ncbi:MAG: hypothetical protein WC693_02890 [Patescibacteria group bacterium]|jgi:UDP-3-O-[3-hydroxymyristoyl] N-acetylglucosamine deacetylase/3-hydroxyacyl-[acyl-carrier-protein] dehydratase
MEKKPHTIGTVTFDQIRSKMPHTGRALLIQEDVIVALGDNMLPVGGTTCFTPNANHCSGHFPGYPVCPAHILVELAAQLLGVVAYGPTLWLAPAQEDGPSVPFFRGLGEATFRLIATPEHILVLTAEITSMRSALVVGNVKIECTGKKKVADIKGIRIAPK